MLNGRPPLTLRRMDGVEYFTSVNSCVFDVGDVVGGPNGNLC